MKKIILPLLILFLSSFSFAQEIEKTEYQKQTEDIKSRLKTKKSEKKEINKNYYPEKTENEAVKPFFMEALENEKLFLYNDSSLSKSQSFLDTPHINVVSRVINSALNKYIDNLFGKKEHDYLVIPISKLKEVFTYADCRSKLNSKILEVEIGLRIDSLLIKEFVNENILDSNEILDVSSPLSDLFVSGFSLSPMLNRILDTIKAEFSITKESISLTEADGLTTIKDCINIIKEKVPLLSGPVDMPGVKGILKYIPFYFTAAKSSDEIIKPRLSRAPVSYSFNSSSESRIFDAYIGFNLLGFTNNWEMLNVFLGPVWETHINSSAKGDLVNTESRGFSASATCLWANLCNARIKGFFYYAWKNDYKNKEKPVQYKLSASLSFQPRDAVSKYFLPSYEPVGYKNRFFTDKEIEIVSYTWSPSVSYDFTRKGNTKTEELGPLSGTINTSVYLFQRVVQLDASWKFWKNIVKNSINSLDEFNTYRTFAIKLNAVDIKSKHLSPIVKGFKISFGFSYEDGLNFVTGTDQVIRSLTFGIGF